MKRDIRFAIWVGFFAMTSVEPAFASDLIEFTNKVATFTNLQGEVFTKVLLQRGDLDGVIWRNGVSGGRVCYTNLHPALLKEWGIPSNRIDIARTRAQRKAIDRANYHAIAVAEARAQAVAKAKEDAELKAAAEVKAVSERKKSDLEAIEDLERQIESAKSRMRKAKAIAHDYNEANAGNDYAPRVYIKETERVKIQEAEAQLKRMKREFAVRYGETP